MIIFAKKLINKKLKLLDTNKKMKNPLDCSSSLTKISQKERKS